MVSMQKSTELLCTNGIHNWSKKYPPDIMGIILINKGYRKLVVGVPPINISWSEGFLILSNREKTGVVLTQIDGV